MSLDDLSLPPNSGATPGASLSPYALLTLGADGVIGSWNSGIRSLLGYEDYEFVGQHIEILYPPGDLAAGAIERELAEARQFGEAQHDHWLLHKDGTRVWVNCVIHSLGEDASGTTRFVKILRHDRAGHASTPFSLESAAEFVPVLRSRPTGIAILEQPAERIVDVNEARCPS